jgi:hypothetical protein
VVGVALLLNPDRLGELAVHVHVNNVPATLEVRVIPVAELLHCDLLSGTFDRFGDGYTVTTKLEKVPGHPLAEGVIR